MSGFFITFEGIDKSGKTTQLGLLADRLQAGGRATMVTHEPGGTSVGGEIRNLVLTNRSEPVSPTAELLLFVADRAHHTDLVIRPSLDQGKIVISDRYVDSTLAYQGFGRGLDLDQIRQLMAISTGGLSPDLTVLVDIEPKTSRERRGDESPDRMERGDDAFFGRVRDGYLQLANAEPDRFLKVDGTQSRESQGQLIFSEVERRIGRNSATGKASNPLNSG